MARITFDVNRTALEGALRIARDQYREYAKQATLAGHSRLASQFDLQAAEADFLLGRTDIAENVQFRLSDNQTDMKRPDGYRG